MVMNKIKDKLNGNTGLILTSNLAVFIIVIIYFVFFFDARVDAKIESAFEDSSRLTKIEMNIKSICKEVGATYIE